MCRDVSCLIINKIEEMNLGVILKNATIVTKEQSAAVACADDVDLATNNKTQL